MRDLERDTFVLSYSSPYSFYRNTDTFSTNSQLLVANYFSALICSLTYMLRGGGSSKITFASYVLLCYRLYQDSLDRLDRNNEVMAIQLSLLLCISDINQHSERQRLSISILA